MPYSFWLFVLLTFSQCFFDFMSHGYEHFQYPVNVSFTNTKTGENILFNVIPFPTELEAVSRAQEICEYLTSNGHIGGELYEQQLCEAKTYSYLVNLHPDVIKVFFLPVLWFSSEFMLFVRDISNVEEFKKEIALSIHIHRHYIHNHHTDFIRLPWETVRAYVQSHIESLLPQIMQNQLSFNEEMIRPTFAAKEVIFPDPTAGVLDNPMSMQSTRVYSYEGETYVPLSSCKSRRAIDISNSDDLTVNSNQQTPKDLSTTISSSEIGTPHSYQSGFRHYEALVQSRVWSDQFRSAFPWPHISLDHMLDPQLARQASDELQYFAETRSVTDADWEVFYNNKEFKFARRNFRKYGPATRKIISELKSEPFLLFLERVTGIAGLIPDPYDKGAAMHIIQPGGYLQVHKDFAYHYQLHLHRRVNVLLYLNDEDWQADWQGQLELWAPLDTVLANKTDFKNIPNQTVMCSARNSSLLLGQASRIVPLFNRMVVLELNEHSYHGHPQVLVAPAGRLRKSIAMYYYTSGAQPPVFGSIDHTTDFVDLLPEKQ